jgi:hypothetical protein
MTRVNRVDRGQIGKQNRTPQGFLRVDATATRTGVLDYRNPDGTLRRELRHPDEVGKAESLQTLALVPVTDEHPPQMVTAHNARQYGRGHTGEQVVLDGGLVKTGVTITDADLIAKIETSRAQELSCGYTCDLVMEPGEYNGERYDARQTNIVYNHLAVVPRGRAGPVARLHLDAAEEVSPGEEPEEGDPTPMPKITIDGVELEVADASTALAITTKMRSDALKIEQLGKDVEKARKDADEAQAKTDTVQAKLDTAEEKLKERQDADVPALVRARLELERKAAPLLPADTKLDALTDRQVKEAVIKAVSPSVDLSQKSDAYVEARFDAAIEDGASRQNHTGATRQGATPPPAGRQDSQQRVDHDAARQQMIEDNRNAWKKGAK